MVASLKIIKKFVSKLYFESLDKAIKQGYNFFIQFFYNFEAVGRPTNRGAELLHGDEKTSRQESRREVILNSHFFF